MRYAVITPGGRWLWTNDPGQAVSLATAYDGKIVDYKPGPRAGEGIIEQEKAV